MDEYPYTRRRSDAYVSETQPRIENLASTIFNAGSSIVVAVAINLAACCPFKWRGSAVFWTVGELRPGLDRMLYLPAT